MFIRESITVNKDTKNKYVTHKLVESYRIGDKVRQRVIMSLGTLTLPKKRWKELAALLESRISGQESFLDNDAKISVMADELLNHNKFVKNRQKDKLACIENASYEEIDMNSISTTENRTLGPELIANEFWNKLEFDAILKKCHFSPKQLSVAKAIIVGRLINPDSELATFKWFKERTALLEMTSEDISSVGKDAFYEIGDLLFGSKERIEKELYSVENKLFSLGKKIYLYDLTNTYIEGSGKNNKNAKYGHSKEKRFDCPLITLALVVDEYGFPSFSQIYGGNQSEPETLKDILNKLDKDTTDILGDERPILIMDRGIATKDNIELIKEKNYSYTVVNRKQTEKHFEEDFNEIKNYLKGTQLEIPLNWESIDGNNEVFVKKIIKDNMAFVLSSSVGRIAKESSMDELKEKRFLEDIEKLKTSFTKGNIKVPIKLAERVGKIKAKYPTVNKYYEIDIKVSEDNSKITDITWNKKEQRTQRSNLTGCYVIETTQINNSAVEIWKQYMLLGRVENAFRDLKSALGIRPIHHQTAERTSAHLFIGVLAYHLLNSIEVSLQSKGDSRSWKTIKEIVSTHQRSTVILRNKTNTIFYVRVSSRPEPEHNEIYRLLKIKDTLKRKTTQRFQRL